MTLHDCPLCHKKRTATLIGIKSQSNPVTRASEIKTYKCLYCSWEFSEEGWVYNNPSHRYSEITYPSSEIKENEEFHEA